MDTPSMLRLSDVMERSGYSEEDVLSLGIQGELSFLVVVPLLGACRVPDVALSHFMAGAEEFDAVGMPEHWSGTPCGPYTIKAERLRILEDDWDKFDEKAHKLSAALDRQEIESSARQSRGFFTLREAARLVANANGLDGATLLWAMTQALVDDMPESTAVACHDGYLTVHDPVTEKPRLGTRNRALYDWVTLSDINAILLALVRPYRFSSTQTPSEGAQTDEVDPAPAVAPLGEGSKPVTSERWWRLPPYDDIFELAKNIGATIHAKRDRTSNTAIAKGIAERINSIEKSKGRDRTIDADTVRGALTGWRFKPD